MPAQVNSPLPTSRPSPGLEIVPGKDIPHWSGMPIWGKTEAENLGFKLPPPIGLSTTYYAQKEGFRMPELKLGYGSTLLNAGGLVRVPDIKISEHAEIIRLDAWVLPFINLYALAGYVDGNADIAIEPAFLPPRFGPRFNLHLNYEGPTVGFGMADLNVTETFLDFQHVVTSLKPVTVLVLNVRGGVRDRLLHSPSLGDIYWSAWGGVMWEGVQEVMSGSVSILNLDFQGNIEAYNQWSTIVGGGLEVGKHISLMIDVGCGERRSLMLSATVRF